MAHYAYYNLEKLNFTQIKEAKKSFKKQKVTFLFVDRIWRLLFFILQIEYGT